MLNFLIVYIFVCALLRVESRAGQKQRKPHESSDTESDKGQSH